MSSHFKEDILRINNISNHVLKDMAVIINSRSLINILSPQLKYAVSIEELISLENEQFFNKSWIEISNKKRASLPLGKYAEYLFGEALETNKNIKVIFKNLQLNDTTRTIGEIDFLFKDLTKNNYYHLEFAQKYYLKTFKNNKVRYLGPSKKDWYKNKLNKLIESQLSLTTEYRVLLPTEVSSINFSIVPLMKGSLFYPETEYDVNKASFEYGWWMTIDKFFHADISSDYLFQAIFNRKDWIFPFFKGPNYFTKEELVKEIENNESVINGAMVVRYSKNKTPIDRGFLMKAKWPSND